MKFDRIDELITDVEPNSVFLEVGSDRGDRSTEILADLAVSYGTKLISVDIDPQARHRDTFWDTFYRDIRASNWSIKTDSWESLPMHIQQDILDHNDYSAVKDNHSQSLLYDKTRIHHPGIEWVTAKGSDWAKSYRTNSAQKISLLLLDNFDWTYNNNHEKTDVLCKNLAVEYQSLYNVEMTNHQCQMEHFVQLVNLYPFFTEDCLVIFDDTYLDNGCWTGKCGPGVVYLLSLGFEIVKSNGSAFLKKPRNRS